MVPAFTVSKALWLKRHKLESWATMATILLAHDYINLWLTGRVVAEPGDASGTGVLERPAAAATAAAYDRGACALVDDRFVAMLAPLSSPDAVVGDVLAARRGDLGLPPDHGDGRCRPVRVSAGSGDNMCSALGVGAGRAGRLVASLGRSGTLFAWSAAPVHDASGDVAPFRDAAGAFLPLLCVQNCTDVLKEGLMTATQQLRPKDRGRHIEGRGLSRPSPASTRPPLQPSASYSLDGPSAVATSNVIFHCGRRTPNRSSLAGVKYFSASLQRELMP